MLKSRSTWPPGGWKFTQPETGWSLPPGLGFMQSVDTIIAHRSRNPRFSLSLDRSVVADELDAYTCALLKNDPNWCSETQPRSFIQTPPMPRRVAGEKQQAPIRKSVAGVSKFINNAGAGIKVWIDWFGNGKLVDKNVADQRALICLKCPENQKGDLMERFGAAVGMEILEIFTSLNALNTHTGFDDRLHICNICSCPLKAKVWCPLPVAKKYMDDEMMKKLPDFCWLRAEA